MTSKELTDAYGDKLDGIIQFFVREKELKIHYIILDKENSKSIYANFLVVISIVVSIMNIVVSDSITSLVLVGIWLLLLVVGMFVVNYLIYKYNKKRDDDYESTTHKFDVIISYLQILKILTQCKELSKLVCTMKNRPREIGNKNKSYEEWLDNVYHCVTQLSTCD